MCTCTFSHSLKLYHLVISSCQHHRVDDAAVICMHMWPSFEDTCIRVAPVTTPICIKRCNWTKRIVADMYVYVYAPPEPVTNVLVKKPVMVGKVLSVTTSLTAKESSAVEQIWQDWREGHF